ncbi:MAG: PEP-CTERM sorting domain-containing protein [Planctomycetota bacterium]
MIRTTPLIAGVLAVAATSSAALAQDINDYTLARTFDLPAAGPFSVGTVLFDDLPDGRLLTLNGFDVAVETASQSGTFMSIGSISGIDLGFGPSFLQITPDGTQAAVGSNGNGSVLVFDTSDPSTSTSFAVQDFNAAWIDNTQLAIANAAQAVNGVQVLDTTTGSVTSIITNIGGASAGITFDAAGNLYTGNGFSFDTGTSDTGWIKAFSPAEWQSALGGGTAIDFETGGIPVANLLSAASLGFDDAGNLFVGGADFFGTSGDLGYAALVDADAITDALANPSSLPPIDANSPTDVLRQFASPQSTIDGFQSPAWSFNQATSELYLRYFQDGEVQAFVVPEPSSLTVLGVGALALLRRRRKVAAAMVATSGVAAAANTAVADYVFDADDFAVEVVESVGLNDNGLYDNAQAVLGAPSVQFNTSFSGGTQFRRIKLIEPAFNTGLNGEDLITTFNAGQSLTVRMGRPAEDDPLNPFGIDLNVFGNAFFTGSGGLVNDQTNLNTFNLNGGIFAEGVQVSVSPDNVNWYTYDSGPTGDGLAPTNAYVWDRDAAAWTDELLDPTVPIDPSLTAADFAGTAADALDLYAGSAGGAGFDLAVSGFASIEFVRFDGVSGFAGGEIDAVADVRPIPEPASLGVLGVAGLALLRRHRG